MEPLPAVIVLPQRWGVPIEPIEALYIIPVHSMRRIVQQEPLQTLIFPPLNKGAVFRGHKAELSSGVGQLVHGQQPKPCELPPVITGHPPHQAKLPMHDLVMAQRQNKSFGEAIGHGEGQLIVVIGAEWEIRLTVFQRIVHPAHVPLIVEAQTAGGRVPRHMGPR